MNCTKSVIRFYLYIFVNDLSASGRRCWSGRARGFPGNCNAGHKSELQRDLQFVMSQIQENKFVVQISRSL